MSKTKNKLERIELDEEDKKFAERIMENNIFAERTKTCPYDKTPLEAREPCRSDGKQLYICPKPGCKYQGWLQASSKRLEQFNKSMNEIIIY